MKRAADRAAPTLALLLANLAARHDPSAETVPGWSRIFRDRGVEGTAVVHRIRDGRVLVHDEARAGRRFLPASTFAIANALVGLETGAIAHERERFRWDRKPKLVDAWERDHDLATGLRENVAWVFQEVARRVGRPAMGEWLDRLDYGNRDMTGGIDQFWLQGGLRISALEQAAFLRRLAEGRLPVRALTRARVREALPCERCGDREIRAIAGTARRGDRALAWWVGWVEDRGEPVASFAVNHEGGRMRPDAGRDIGRAVLEDAGAWPWARPVRAA